MFKNYFKVALRNLFKHKAYSIINIAGLAIGITCCFLVILYVKYERSYDRYHEKADRIYRVAAEFFEDGRPAPFAGSPGPLAPALRTDFPEIEKAARIFDCFGAKILVARGEKRFYEPRLFYADAEFFQIFSFSFLQGNPQTALKEPFSIVITESMAKKYFGSEDPLNKVLSIANKHDFKVTGVIEDVPPNSHFSFDFMASFSSLNTVYYDNFYTYWGAWNFYTYILLAQHALDETLRERLPAFYKKHIDPEDQGRLLLQPLTAIHLHSHLRNEIAENGDINNLYFFSAIAVIILLIAGINFINLSTARAATRAKEVGVRKVIGAQRQQLVRQFIGESMLLTLLAFPLALMLLEVALPVLNELAGRNISLKFFNAGDIFAPFLGIVLLIGFIGGSYPAFFLSAFQPVAVFRGALQSRLRGNSFRSVLVTGQFAVSVILIVSTLIVFRQLDFIQNKNLGLNKEHVLLIPLKSEAQKNYQTVKTGLLKEAAVLGASATSFTPGGQIWHEGFSWDNDQKTTMIDRISVDADFFDVFEIKVAEGRHFSRDFVNDPTEAYMVNATAMTHFNWTPPVIGKQVSWNGRQGRIVGVVKDFNYKSLHQKVQPLLITNRPSGFTHLAVKIRGDNLPRTLNTLREKWTTVFPDYPFEYSFFDEDFDRLYKAELHTREVFGYFSFLAIFVACLGLLGLSAFTTSQRTKEIGIRKVLGASVSGIVYLISKDFIKLVLISNLIAWPAAVFIMRGWLQNFAYRIDMDIGSFILAACLALLTALLTVSFQAVKAAFANPVDSLRYE